MRIQTVGGRTPGHPTTRSVAGSDYVPPGGCRCFVAPCLGVTVRLHAVPRRCVVPAEAPRWSGESDTDGDGVTDPLVLLVLVWAVLLVPGAFRSRNASPHVTVGGFERAMNVLSSGDRGGGRELLVPSDTTRIVDHRSTTSSPAATRSSNHTTTRTSSRSASMPSNDDPLIAQRRSRFERALLGTAATLVLAVLVGGWLWPAFVLVAGGTAGYATILRRLKLQRDQARQVVRELDLTTDDVGESSRTRVAVGGGDVGDGFSTVRLRRWED